MRLLIASEAHFARDPEGRTYAEGPEDAEFWGAYTEVFEEVRVLARVHPVRRVPAGARRADGGGVTFQRLDGYRGPWEYLAAKRRLRRQAAEAVGGAAAFVLRVPGAVGYLAWDEIRRRERPYGIEVLGDPWESLGVARGAGLDLTRRVARAWSRNRLRAVCRQAPVASYVTRGWLQERYPPGGGAVFSCSDARLESPVGEGAVTARLDRSRSAGHRMRPWQLGFVGSLETLCKAPEVHLEAVALCRGRGLDLRLSIAGDGRHRAGLERLARELGIADIVRFLGTVPAGEKVREFLDGIDLFVLASRTEGLPRALIEAMARGCPAVGSACGGIPELLEAESLVEPGSAEALAGKIREVLGDAARLEVMARRNRVEAFRYAPERLTPVRREFLCELRRWST